MKLSKEVLSKIRNIEIHTRRLLNGTMMGDYSSAKKGSGMEFDQLREYQPGDDVRSIDWKGTARSQKVLTKQYIEERNRSFMLVVDTSASMTCGSTPERKQELAAQVASVLALVGHYNKDNVGLLLFDNEVETYIKPSRGLQHIHFIMETVFTSKPSGKTSLQTACKKLLEMRRKDMMVFLISDFIAPDYQTSLSMLSKHNETVALWCQDPIEEQFAPGGGTLEIYDPETNTSGFIDTRSTTIKHLLDEHAALQKQLFTRCAVDMLKVIPGRPFIGDLIQFCRQRLLY